MSLNRSKTSEDSIFLNRKIHLPKISLSPQRNVGAGCDGLRCNSLLFELTGISRTMKDPSPGNMPFIARAATAFIMAKCEQPRVMYNTFWDSETENSVLAMFGLISWKLVEIATTIHKKRHVSFFYVLSSTILTISPRFFLLKTKMVHPGDAWGLMDASKF